MRPFLALQFSRILIMTCYDLYCATTIQMQNTGTEPILKRTMWATLQQPIMKKAPLRRHRFERINKRASWKQRRERRWTVKQLTRSVNLLGTSSLTWHPRDMFLPNGLGPTSKPLHISGCRCTLNTPSFGFVTNTGRSTKSPVLYIQSGGEPIRGTRNIRLSRKRNLRISTLTSTLKQLKNVLGRYRQQVPGNPLQPTQSPRKYLLSNNSKPNSPFPQVKMLVKRQSIVHPALLHHQRL